MIATLTVKSVLILFMTLIRRQVTDQVGSDTQVFSDGVLVLSGCRGLTDSGPLAVNLPHRVLWNFREHRFGCVVFLQR